MADLTFKPDDGKRLLCREGEERTEYHEAASGLRLRVSSSGAQNPKLQPGRRPLRVLRGQGPGASRSLGTAASESSGVSRRASGRSPRPSTVGLRPIPRVGALTLAPATGALFLTGLRSLRVSIRDSRMRRRGGEDWTRPAQGACKLQINRGIESLDRSQSAMYI